MEMQTVVSAIGGNEPMPPADKENHLFSSEPPTSAGSSLPPKQPFSTASIDAFSTTILDPIAPAASSKVLRQQWLHLPHHSQQNASSTRKSHLYRHEPTAEFGPSGASSKRRLLVTGPMRLESSGVPAPVWCTPVRVEQAGVATSALDGLDDVRRREANTLTSAITSNEALQSSACFRQYCSMPQAIQSSSDLEVTTSPGASCGSALSTTTQLFHSSSNNTNNSFTTNSTVDSLMDISFDPVPSRQECMNPVAWTLLHGSSDDWHFLLDHSDNYDEDNNLALMEDQVPFSPTSPSSAFSASPAFVRVQPPLHNVARPRPLRPTMLQPSF